jgi:hypothetical protein
MLPAHSKTARTTNAATTTKTTTSITAPNMLPNGFPNEKFLADLLLLSAITTVSHTTMMQRYKKPKQ